MNLDVQILQAAIQDRTAYERICKHVAPKEFNPQVSFWWKLVSEYYGRDRASKRVDVGTLRAAGESRITNPKHRDGLLGVLDGTASAISVPNVVDAVLSLKRWNTAGEFANAAMAGDSEKAKKLLGVVNDLWQRDTLDQEERKYASSVEDIFDVVGTEKRITDYKIGRAHV